ncbi:MAG: hypothetical protein HY033_09590 [Ignavibacteriae bacterium]|nr:hypothetical protein [Ignavibacteriota bacterium]
MTKEEIDKLYQDNLKQFTSMRRGAGNLVKGLLFELQDDNRNTYITLRDAVPDGFVVFYDMKQGDPNLVLLVAQTLGFKSWDAHRLEVHSA